ncbi:MAG TPA: VOC family protein [Bryobacteraceae bacterium]|nr:VOC family protein [Bryobacteraceae bacterium]
MGRPVVHFEIGCRDQARTGDFYSKLFGWQITTAGPASNIQTGSSEGIPGHITSLGHEPEHYTTFYVDVEDVQAALDKAVDLGGKKLVGPIKIPTGTFAWFSDPDGNMIGLLKPARP